MPHATGDLKMAIRQRASEQPAEESAPDHRVERIRTKNRRKRYLDLHPEYFKTAEIELAGRYQQLDVSLLLKSPATKT